MPKQNTTDNCKLTNKWLSFCFNKNELKYKSIVALFFLYVYMSMKRFTWLLKTKQILYIKLYLFQPMLNNV